MCEFSINYTVTVSLLTKHRFVTLLQYLQIDYKYIISFDQGLSAIYYYNIRKIFIIWFK